MGLNAALIISVVAQFIAFFITVSLIPKTKFSIAWISISIGFLLMALRRLFELVFQYGPDSDGIATLNSWVAVIISAFMLISSIYIRKIFKVLNRIHQLRKENEAKMLSAVINTEEKERKHFSKELHDGLGPLLSSAKMTLSAMDRSRMQKQDQNMLNKAENMVECAITTIREISNHLTPSVLERYGLKKAVETFVRNTDLKDSIDLSIESNIAKKRYNLNLEVILYRICCELINNTLKHASASRITLHLLDRSDVLELLYNDNGIGFEKMDETHGMGLNNIRSRVKSLKGTLELISSPGEGFHARIELPI